MAEISRVAHVVPAPPVAHDPHRVHHADGNAGREGKKRESREDALELHDEAVDPSNIEAAAVETAYSPRDSDGHIDIAV